MDGPAADDVSSTTPVSITVLSVSPIRAGKLFALAAVEIDVDGVLIEIHGIRALHVPPAATRIELPTFRDPASRSQAAIVLPEEVRCPIGDAVLDQLVELGLAVKRPVFTSTQLPDARAVAFPAAWQSDEETET
jgi:stage V sporulation protein G